MRAAVAYILYAHAKQHSKDGWRERISIKYLPFSICPNIIAIQSFKTVVIAAAIYTIVGPMEPFWWGNFYSITHDIPNVL